MTLESGRSITFDQNASLSSLTSGGALSNIVVASGKTLTITGDVSGGGIY